MVSLVKLLVDNIVASGVIALEEDSRFGVTEVIVIDFVEDVDDKVLSLIVVVCC